VARGTPGGGQRAIAGQNDAKMQHGMLIFCNVGDALTQHAVIGPTPLFSARHLTCTRLNATLRLNRRFGANTLWHATYVSSIVETAVQAGALKPNGQYNGDHSPYLIVVE
jgi:hypothetical protein